MAIQNISALPDAPTPADSAEDFATKAAAFVPALSTFQEELNQFGEDVTEEVIAQIEAAQDTVNITAQGLFDSIIVGDTDGINTEFDILNASFYPYFAIYQDGLKIPSSDIIINGTTATLTTAPTSGAVMEAITPRSIDFIAPDGFKTIAFISDKNGTIELNCDVDGAVLPQWKVGDIATESESFSYSNDGNYICVYLYIPDDSSSTIDAEAQDIYLIDIQENTYIDRLKMRDNSDLNYYESLVNIKGLTNLGSAWYNCSGMSSFPLIDSSDVIGFFAAWFGCSGLVSFPNINTASATTFNAAWRNCTSLTTFPLLDSSSVSDFNGAWRGCSSLSDFPSLNYSLGTDFNQSWVGCGLTEDSVDLILSDLNRYDVSNCTIGLNGGTNATPSASGLTDKADLELRGCTVNTN